jgi:hypothetical protein
MSNTYRRICLSHEPPLWIDEDDYEVVEPPEQPPDHPDCVIGIGRYSGGLAEIWLPIKYSTVDREAPGKPWTHHPGKWYDVSWLNHGRFPALARHLAGRGDVR